LKKLSRYVTTNERHLNTIMEVDHSQQTQPFTQAFSNSHRTNFGTSRSNDCKMSDVLLILHPASQAATKIVEHTALHRPEHVLFRNLLDSMGEFMNDVEEQGTFTNNAHEDQLKCSSPAGTDLALRLSSAKTLKFKQLGFIFGRNYQSADIIFGQDSMKRISKQHFRIYLNVDGIIMLEDMSTNGTFVDETLLKSKDPHSHKIRMLIPESIIYIPNSNDSEIIKFIVRIPSRGSYMQRFRDNLRNFIIECTPNTGEDLTKAAQRVVKQYGGLTMKWDGGTNYNIIGECERLVIFGIC
jgi:hypothetical protein